MKKISFFFLFLNLLPLFGLAQTDAAQIDLDYTYFVEKDDIGSGYITYSCYLKNISDNKVLFYNFKIKDEAQGFEFLKSLPEDIIILDPHRTKRVCKLKVNEEIPNIQWLNFFLYPSVGFNKFPEQEKDYVFFYETSENEDDIRIDYYIKSISDRRIKLFDLKYDNPDRINIVKQLVELFYYIEPNTKLKILAFESVEDFKLASVTWRSEFTKFQPTNDPFCKEFIKIMEAAEEGDFGSVKGELTGQDQYSCLISMKGIEETEIVKVDGNWWFVGQVGKNDEKKPTENKLKEWIIRVEDCLPDSLELTEKKDKESKNKQAIFAGFMKDKLHGIYLKIMGSPGDPNNYTLNLMVLGSE